MRKSLEPRSLVAYLVGDSGKPVAVAELLPRAGGEIEVKLDFEGVDGPKGERDHARRFRKKLVDLVEGIDHWLAGRHTQKGPSDA